MYRSRRTEVCPQCNNEVEEGDVRERPNHYAIAMTTFEPEGYERPTMRCCGECEAQNADCI